VDSPVPVYVEKRGSTKKESCQSSLVASFQTPTREPLATLRGQNCQFKSNFFFLDADLLEWGLSGLSEAPGL
jgi:hypothetical protein